MRCPYHDDAACAQHDADELDGMSFDLGVLLGTAWELQRVVHTLAVAHDMEGVGRTAKLTELADALVATVERTVVNAGDGAHRVRALVDALREVQR